MTPREYHCICARDHHSYRRVDMGDPLKDLDCDHTLGDDEAGGVRYPSGRRECRAPIKWAGIMSRADTPEEQ